MGVVTASISSFRCAYSLLCMVAKSMLRVVHEPKSQSLKHPSSPIITFSIFTSWW